MANLSVRGPRDGRHVAKLPGYAVRAKLVSDRLAELDNCRRPRRLIFTNHERVNVILEGTHSAWVPDDCTVSYPLDFS